MKLRNPFGKAKEEEPVEMVCWQDGHHRSFEPMQRANQTSSRSSLSARRLRTIAGATAVAVVAHFSGVTGIIAEIITAEKSSSHAPLTSGLPPSKPFVK